MGNGKRYLHCLKPTGAHPCSVGNFLKTDKGIISRTNKKPVISRRSRYLNAKMSKRCEKMMHRSYSDKWKEAHSPPPKKEKTKRKKKRKEWRKGDNEKQQWNFTVCPCSSQNYTMSSVGWAMRRKKYLCTMGWA